MIGLDQLGRNNSDNGSGRNDGIGKWNGEMIDRWK